MSKKKKLSKRLRDQRRFAEAEKANARPSYVVTQAQSNYQTVIPVQLKEKDVRFTLPIKEIKHDMVRTLLYIGFTVFVLMVLRITKVDFTTIAKVLSGHQ